MNFFSQNANEVNTYINTTVYPGVSTQGEGIDLRVEFHWLLYGNGSINPKGHWVVLRKYNRSKKSIYYNETTHEGVNGPAFTYEDTLLRTRRLPIAFKGNPLEPLKAGQAIDDRYLYYFEYTVKPKRGDHIIELSVDDHTNQPTVTKNIMAERYRITAVHPYRLDNGNVQYYAIQAEIDETSN